MCFSNTEKEDGFLRSAPTKYIVVLVKEEEANQYNAVGKATYIPPRSELEKFNTADSATSSPFAEVRTTHIIDAVRSGHHQ